MGKWTILTVFNGITILLLSIVMGVQINVSPSYPIGIYRVQYGNPKKGDLVSACLPNSAVRIGVDREYFMGKGNCKTHPAVIKRVVGVAGDDVVVDSKIYINGTEVPNANLTTADPLGRRLDAAEGGVINDGHVWLMSTFTSNSFDSRYFGEVPAEKIRHKVEPLWTF